MKKLLICALMGFCMTLTASATTIGYEPPKVGIDVPDIGYSVPVTDFSIVAIDGQYQMVQTATVQGEASIAAVPFHVVKVCPLSAKMDVSPCLAPDGNSHRLCIHPPVAIGFSQRNLINAPVPYAVRTTDNTFRQRSMYVARYTSTASYGYHRYNPLN